jgi:hypothetical protein
MNQIIGTIAAAALSPALLRLLEYFFREQQERRRQAEESLRVKVLVLKCVITNNELSRQDRPDAYYEYKRESGNSGFDKYVLERLQNIED